MKKALIGKYNLNGQLAQLLAAEELKLNNKNAHPLYQVENHVQDLKFLLDHVTMDHALMNLKFQSERKSTQPL